MKVTNDKSTDYYKHLYKMLSLENTFVLVMQDVCNKVREAKTMKDMFTE